MKVVFPNSASVHARERLLMRGGRLKRVRLKVRYGIVVHPQQGPVLIDTGYSAHAVSAPNRSFPLRFYSNVLRPELNVEEQPKAVLEHLGFEPEDVRRIIVTHFHADHACALKDFPNARFVVNGAAWAGVSNASRFANLRHGVFPELLPRDFGDRVVPLEHCQTTPDGTDIFADNSLIAVPLPGHAAGHFGVLINTDPAPIFYGVDAQWLRQAVVEDRAPRFPARLIMDDYGDFLDSSRLLACSIIAGRDVVLCHDPEDGPHDWQD